jgi:hypothetical protein
LNNVWHANTGSNDDTATLTLTSANLLKLVQTVTDADGDTATASINLGTGVFQIQDDGPSASVANSVAAAMILDESALPDPAENPVINDGVNDGIRTFTASFAGNFNAPVYGTDGMGGVVYSLQLTGSNVGSGLYALDPTDKSIVDGDGYGQGAQIVLNQDGNTITGSVGQTNYFTITINPATGQVTFTQLNNVWHANTGSNDDTATLTLTSANLLKLVQTVTDADGDTATASINLGTGVFQIQDDGPSGIAPDGLYIENVGMPGIGDQYYSNLNFVPGTDGVGSVVFNAADIDAGFSGVTLVPGALTSSIEAKDANGNNLTVSGQQLYLYLSADGMTLTASVGQTFGGNVGYTIVLNGDSGQYIFNAEAVISNGTEIFATNLNSVGGGNIVLKAISNIGGTTEDVVLTTKSGFTVNTNNKEIGIGAGNSLSPAVGDSIRIDFTNGTVAGSGGNAVYTYESHNLTTSFRQIVNLTSGASSAAIKVTAIRADNDTVFYGDPDGESVVGVANIRVYSGTLSQVSAGIAVDVTSQVTITDNGDGTFNIVGIKDGWIYEVETAESFSALQIDALTDGGAGNFKLSYFSYGDTSVGDSIDLNYNILGVDGDGDAVNGSVEITLFPNEDASTGSNLTGTGLDDILLGTNGDDIIQGAAGGDFIAGNFGNDTLIGGPGEDTMYGGSGSDTFKYFAGDLDGSIDQIMDFQVGTGGDTIELSGVLQNYIEGTSDLAKFVKIEVSGNTATVSVDVDGEGGSQSFTEIASVSYSGDLGTDPLQAMIDGDNIKIS